jgi:long-chain acyl-CoA synthetase
MLWRRFTEGVERALEQEAVVAASVRLTYADLFVAAEALSSRLTLHGVRPGDPVALFLPNGTGFVTAFLAILRSGGVAAPLNVHHQQNELTDSLQQTKPRIVLTDPERFSKIAPILEVPRGVNGPSSSPRLLCLDPEESFPPITTPPVAPHPDRPALYQYSTGSTGRPKPVIRTQGQLIAEVDHFTRAVSVTPQDRILAVVPLFHAHGIGNTLLAALMNGATMVILESFSPRGVLSALQNEQVTIYPGVPFMFKLLTETKIREAAHLKTLRLCFSAGAPLSPEVGRDFHRQFGVPVRQLYGSTETGSVTLNLDADIEATCESVGRAMSPAEVAIFDESGARLPVGQTGEIGIRSPAMTGEYPGLPDATAASFRNGFFFPGDVGHLDAEGRLYVTGRVTFFINVGGQKVDPAEVERVIATHPKVREVVVLGVSDPGGQERIKAAIVPHAPCGPSEILDFCQGKLADYKLPRIITFYNEIPKSPLGKVLRKHLQ